VRILEARDRVGGRCWTLRNGDRVTELGGAEQLCRLAPERYFNPGPIRIQPWHGGVLGYLHALGLPYEPFLSGPMDENWVLRRTPGHPLAGQRLRFRQLNRDMIGYAMAHLRAALGAAETVTGREPGLAGWVERFGTLDPTGRYRGTAARGYAVPPGDAFSKPILETLLPEEEVWSYGSLGTVPTLVNSARFPAPTLAITGGMDRLPKALAARLPRDAIQLNAELVRLRQDPTGVSVDWQDLTTGTVHRERAGHAICTIPFILLSRIDTDFEPAIKGIVASLAYEPSVKVALEFGRRFWELDDGIHGGYSFIDDPALYVVYPSHGLGSAGGLITNYYYGARDALRLSALSPEERARLALADLEMLHPGVRADLTSALSVSWSRVPWSAGCFGAWTDTARATELPHVAAGDRRVLFAGEHISQIPAWMEGAIQSAHAALGQLRERWATQTGAAS
jgi:monoamine oxidase